MFRIEVPAGWLPLMSLSLWLLDGHVLSVSSHGVLDPQGPLPLTRTLGLLD